MKKLILSILIISLLTNIVIAQQGWYILSQYQSSGGSTTDMKFTNNESGYTTFQAGNGHYNYGGISKTTNGGINWVSLEQGVPKYGIFFLNSSTGWMTGGYWDDAGKRSREVFRTTNGGINFTRLYIDSGQSSFSKIFFTDINNGWLITFSELLKTTNSGLNWTTSLARQLYSVFFINPDFGWCAGSDGEVCRTTNGGLNWSIQSLGSNTFREIFFINGNTGWVCGGSVLVYKSTNGGITWFPHNTGQYIVNTLEFSDQNTGWASGDSGKIVYTSDGGLNWIPQNSGVNHNLSLLCFPNANTGYVRGSKIISIYPFTIEEVFLKTTTGGLTFAQKTVNEVPREFSLSQNYPNPFNPLTKIRFDVPLDSRLRGNDNVTLKIYDVLGREITTLVNEQLQPGTYETEWDASNYPSGVYFYKLVVSGAEPLITNDYTETRKMVLIK